MAISLEIRFVNFTTFCKPDLIIQRDFETFFKQFAKFHKSNTMDSAALVSVKLLCSRRVQFYYWSCRITGYLGANVF